MAGSGEGEQIPDRPICLRHVTVDDIQKLMGRVAFRTALQEILDCATDDPQSIAELVGHSGC